MDHHDVLRAVAFAARMHQGQMRKDGKTPYVSHVVRVCFIVRNVFGFENPAMLQTALLHDTIEDTTTDFDDLAKEFSPEVAGWVAALTKDKRLADDDRESAYLSVLKAAPWRPTRCRTPRQIT
jgi:guanosine-3',5'-bis(diphosphate) 3'-pyrophosphohydrolase